MADTYQIARLRKMINDPLGTEYSDAMISYMLGTGTSSGTDLNKIAGDIWADKAAALQATTFDVSSDGESMKRNQKVENALYLSRMYRSRRQVETSLWIKDPDENVDDDGEVTSTLPLL